MLSDAVPDWDSSVGRLVHQAARAEAAMATLARRLSDVDDVAAAHLLPLELEHLVRVVRNLAPVRLPDVRLVSDLLAWTNQVRKLYAVRTSVVHTVWAASDEPRTVRPLWSSGGVAEGTLGTEDVDRTADRLAHLCAGPLDDLLAQVDARLTGPARLPRFDPRTPMATQTTEGSAGPGGGGSVPWSDR